MDLNKRLSSIIEKNKQSNPKFLLELIKSDFYYLINNYFEVDFDDIKVNAILIDNKYQISISCFGDRIKLVRNLPG